jgi:hypothetical protein
MNVVKRFKSLVLSVAADAKVLAAIEEISAAWFRGRMRAIQDAHAPKPEAPAPPPRKKTLGDEIIEAAHGTRESDARQKQWTYFEEHTSVCPGCSDCHEWIKSERPRRVAHLRAVAVKDTQHRFGIDRGQMAAHVGIPENDAAALLESWGLS